LILAVQYVWIGGVWLNKMVKQNRLGQ